MTSRTWTNITPAQAAEFYKDAVEQEGFTASKTLTTQDFFAPGVLEFNASGHGVEVAISYQSVMQSVTVTLLSENVFEKLILSEDQILDLVDGYIQKSLGRKPINQNVSI